MPVTSDQRCSWAPPLLPVARISTTLIRFGPGGPRNAGVKQGASGIRAVDEDALDRLVHRAPLVLVRLVAAQEVQLRAAGGDRLLDVARDHDDARREVARVGVHACVVVEDALTVIEVEAARDQPAADGEARQLEWSVRSEMAEQMAEEAAAAGAALRRRREAVVAPLLLVQLDEVVEVGQRPGRCGEADLAGGFRP